MLYDQYKFRVRVTVHFIISIHFNDISHENFVFLTQIVVKQITLTLIFLLLPAVWPCGSIHTR